MHTLEYNLSFVVFVFLFVLIVINKAAYNNNYKTNKQKIIPNYDTCEWFVEERIHTKEFCDREHMLMGIISKYCKCSGLVLLRTKRIRY